MKRALGFFLFLQLASWLSAELPVMTLASPSEISRVGEESTVTLVLMNPGTAELSYATPGEISAELLQGDKSWPVILKSHGRVPDLIAPGTFVRQEYRLALPKDLRGTAILALVAPVKLRAVLEVGQELIPASRVAKTDGAGNRDTSVPGGLVPRSSASRIERSFRDHFAPHEPVYFIYGARTPAAKFQLSFKYRILGDSTGDPDTTRNSVQFGYTQRSLWDMEGHSSPFYDTSYIPEIFYEYLTPEPPEGSGKITFLGVQAGYMHESNGRDALYSRSLNTLFVRPAVALGHIGGWSVIFMPRIFTYISDLSDNRDIRQYRGFGEARLVVGKNEGAQLSVSSIIGSGWDHRSLQFDFSLPVRFNSGDFATYFLVQYFNGYTESLLRYKEKTSALRAGFSFVR
jgi:outer membrane phospholipase A